MLVDTLNQSSVASISASEFLVRTSTTIYANHVAGSGDLDRIGSDQATPADNTGGSIGNWHDAPCGNPNNAGIMATVGITYNKLAAFRTCSEAQGAVYAALTHARRRLVQL